MSNVGYQSSQTYLALPDILRLSFPSGEGATANAKQAPASEFHAFIRQFVEEFEEVDVTVWPVHQRWRVINACLAEGVLRLSEVPEGYQLEVPESWAEVEPEVEGRPELTSRGAKLEPREALGFFPHLDITKYKTEQEGA